MTNEKILHILRHGKALPHAFIDRARRARKQATGPVAEVLSRAIAAADVAARTRRTKRTD